jgi:hypothetical protein
MSERGRNHDAVLLCAAPLKEILWAIRMMNHYKY